MSDLYNKVRNRWVNDGARLANPTGSADIANRFVTAGLAVASDFVEFYAVVGGMAEYQTDQDLWSCWDIDQIITKSARYSGDGVPFADWMIHSHIHLVRRETDSRSSVWVDHFSDVPIEKVADSFDDFLDRYLKKDETTLIYFDEPTITDRKKPNKSEMATPRKPSD
ncbi:hypothetical protein [Luteolibacter sp. AS25]|uniref:hypothetical protein n=1 Tax=Luteolibacter sp. AS25 TaxID=3135776 RepID=UPI00398B13EE